MEQINKWLEAGTMAPNHKMTQPWEVYVVGAETRGKLNHKTNFCNAPVVLAVISKHGAAEIETYENVLATACFVQYYIFVYFRIRKLLYTYAYILSIHKRVHSIEHKN